MRKILALLGALVIIVAILIIAFPGLLHKKPSALQQSNIGNAFIPLTGQKVIYPQYQYRPAEIVRAPQGIYPQYQYRLGEAAGASQGIYPQYQYRSAEAALASQVIYPQYQYRSAEPPNP